MAMVSGGYAEQVAVDERLVAPVPQALDWSDAAATMVAFMTAHDALVTQGGLAVGTNVLLLGCTTTAGVAAAQIAAWLGAAHVVGTSTTKAKLATMAGWGVDVPVLVPEESVVAAVEQVSSGQGAGIVVDMVGAAAAADALAAAGIGARWISVGRVGGKTAQIDLAEFARKRLCLIGFTFRTRTLDERAAIAAAFARDILPGLAAGHLRAKVDRVFALADASAAQDHIRCGSHFGEVVLRL